MVGDWVYIHEPECKGHRIDSINELDGQVGADGEVYDECDIRQIPLTESILMKNGFVKTWNGDWQLKEYATIIISKDYYVKIFERSIRIDYVHKLQHMLHEACVDKEITL
jgi:hypothetical protein